MYARPAGMSDEDTDEEGFSFPDEIPQPRERVFENNPKIKVAQNVAPTTFHAQDEERTVEFRVINACIMGHIEIVEEYLESHDVNDFLYSGWTPLLYASSSAQPEIVEYLLEQGANPNKHKDGYTPLMALCNTSNGTSSNVLKCLKLLIEASANVNSTSKLKETPLMFACKLREPEVVQELLKHVENINATDNEGRTALIYAVSANRLETVKLIIEQNPDIMLQERNGLTAREIAVLKGYDKIASIINDDEDEIIPSCQISRPTEWKDMFPAFCSRNPHVVDFDVATILYGMGLDQYMNIFQGMDLKTFLRLTDKDLLRLGVDFKVHRQQFIDMLYFFHNKPWSVKSIGEIKKSSLYTYNLRWSDSSK